MELRDAQREVESFGNLWHACGYRIMINLIDRYRHEELGLSKAVVIYGLGTGLGLKAGIVIARELGHKI